MTCHSIRQLVRRRMVRRAIASAADPDTGGGQAAAGARGELVGAERDLEDELAFHLRRSVEALMATGLSEEEARREAVRRFGDAAHYRRELAAIDRGTKRGRRRRERFRSARDAAAHALRSIARSPGLSGGVVLAFALGVGANATMFGILDRLLFRPPAHVVEADAVRRIVVDRFVSFVGRRVQGSSVAWPDYQDLTRAESFSSVAAYTGREMTVGNGSSARRVPAVLATASFFRTLGVRPVLGRFFNEDEDRVGAAGVAVIGYGAWQRDYGGARSVLGRTVDFGDGPYTIIGVTPRGFTGVDLAPVDLWLPLRPVLVSEWGEDWITARGWWFAAVVARLAPGVSVARAEAEATMLHRTGRSEDIRGGHYDADVRLIAAPLIAARGPLSTPESAVAKWLAGVALVVLLIACVNVANLLLARAIRQRRETAIRLALGVSRTRLVGQMLLEGALLGLIGGVAALALAHWGGGIVRRTLLPDVAWDRFGPALTVPLAVLAGAIVAGLVSAILPAIQATRRDVGDALRETAGGITRSAPRIRTLFSLAQAALSVVLLVGAGLFVRSLDRVNKVDLGFDLNGLAWVRPVLARDANDDARTRELFSRALERLERLPAIRDAATTMGTPFMTSYAKELRIAGIDSIPSLPTGGPYIQVVSGDYFATMGLRVMKGRGFQPGDRRGTQQVAVINSTMAEMLWPRGDALGACMHIAGQDACTDVVGIVENGARQGIDEGRTMQYYVPQEQSIIDAAPETLVLRTAGDDPSARALVRRELLALDPAIRFADVQPMRSLIEPETRSWRLGALLFTVFGALALVVAAIGLYSVLAFDVAQRRREIGLRAALGADRRRLVAMVIARSLRVTAAGTAAGALIALALAPRIQPLLFHVPARDPLTLGAVAFTLLLVALLAGYIPARRAARVDPNTALRAD